MIINFILLLLSISFAAKTPENEDYYLAAVVEYSPISGNNSVIENAKEYVKIINEAAPKADIIVFPELGLVRYDHGTYFVLNDTIAPADDKNAHKALRMISEAVRNQSIYAVVNVYEKYDDEASSKTKHYNTNVVFNRTGNILARYRKFHLFNEQLDVPSSAEKVTFTTDFGVDFGTFTCFDILFKAPALQLVRELNVTDIVYPAFWHSALPFLSAVQIQSAWAYATDTNLLASGGNFISSSTTGSGIYGGRKGPIIYLQSQRKETAILYAKVFKKGKGGSSSPYMEPLGQPGPAEELPVFQDPIISEMRSDLITPQSYNKSTFARSADPENPSGYVWRVVDRVEKESCSDGFCCSFVINVTYTFRNSSLPVTPNPYQYRLGVFNGETSFVAAKGGVRLCGVFSCLNSTIQSCGKRLTNTTKSIPFETDDSGKLYLYSTVFDYASIKTENLDEGGLSMPSMLEIGDNPDTFGSLMNLTQYSFSVNSTTGTLQFSSTKLITGAIYGRVFKSASSFTKPSIILVFLSFFYLL